MQAVLRMQGAQNGLAGSSAQNSLDTGAGSSAIDGSLKFDIKISIVRITIYHPAAVAPFCSGSLRGDRRREALFEADQ